MASSINASTSGAGGVITTADNTGILNIQTAGTTAVTVNASQNVGIGTTSPSVKLQVNGVVRAATDNDKGVIGLGESAAGSQVTNCGLWRGGANSAVSTSTGLVTTGGNFLNMGGYDGLVLTTGAASIGSQTERMRIDSSGNVLVGTTSSAQTTSGLKILAAGSGKGITYGASGTENIDFAEFYRNTEGSLTRVGNIRTNGTSTTYTTSSDYRLKENIVPMVGALDTIAQLKPVTYKWKTTGDNGQGFIAHELQAVVPDCVSGEKDAVDEEGNIKPQGIDTSFLVATLTAAIQEMKAIIDEQSARITALENK